MDVQNLMPSQPVMVLMDSANDVYRRVPISSITRSTTTATVKAYDHGLTHGATYTMTGASDAGFNIAAAIAVVDKDTFTYTVAGNIAASATDADMWATDPSSSVVATNVIGVQVETPAAGTTIKIEKRLHPSGSWVQEGTDITSVTATVLVLYSAPMTQVRVRRSGGAGAVLAFAARVRA